MNVIVDFLKNDQELSTFKEEVYTKDSDVEELRELFSKTENNYRLSAFPQRHKGQIWMVKNQYIDYMGMAKRTSHPIMVILTTEEDYINNLGFVRAYPISPFVEMASLDDLVCNDTSFTGFPFIIETWNEQPLLTEILDSFVGYCDINEITEHGRCSMEENESFRITEIRNAQHLGHSIMACMEYQENEHQELFTIDVFDNHSTKSIKSKKNKRNAYDGEDHFSYAAKAGKNSTYQESIIIDDWDFPFSMEVKEQIDGFVATIRPLEEVELKAQDGTSVKPIVTEDRMVFYPLKQGIYYIHSNNDNRTKEIRIK